jgi:hypothetical protein
LFPLTPPTAPTDPPAESQARVLDQAPALRPTRAGRPLPRDTQRLVFWEMNQVCN